MNWKRFWRDRAHSRGKKGKKGKKVIYLRFTIWDTLHDNLFYLFYFFYFFPPWAILDIKCPLSHKADKSCHYAAGTNENIKCSYIIGYYHKMSIKHLDRCFLKMKSRDKLAWQNRMIKKFGKPKI